MKIPKGSKYAFCKTKPTFYLQGVSWWFIIIWPHPVPQKENIIEGRCVIVSNSISTVRYATDIGYDNYDIYFYEHIQDIISNHFLDILDGGVFCQ